jgi:hypothetical protein
VSSHLRDGLERLVLSEPVKPATASRDSGGEWHCPADGERLTFDAGYMQCGRCNRYLPSNLVYEAIEYNWPPASHRN